MRNAIRLSSFVSTLLICTAANAGPPPCSRWVAPITCQMVIKVQLGSNRPCVESGPDDDFVTDHTYRFNRAKTHKTIKAACDAAAKYNTFGHNGDPTMADAQTGTCTFKDANGHTEYMTISFDSIPLDRMCNFNIQGPYAARYDAWKNGYTTPINKKTGKPDYSRWIKNSTLYSKRIQMFVNVPQNYGAPYDLNEQRPLFLLVNRFFNKNKLVSDHPKHLRLGQEATVLNTIPADDMQASLHHIVPAHDSHGCDCGANTIANAALIPRSIDNAIQNNGAHEKLRQIINDWRLPD